MAAPAIETSGLDVGYPGRRSPVTVISGLELTVEAGTFLSILGPSGCGKSTLLRVVADLLAPLAGTIRVMGETPWAVRSGRGVGFVFQDSTLLPWRTARENVRLPIQVGRRLSLIHI